MVKGAFSAATATRGINLITRPGGDDRRTVSVLTCPCLDPNAANDADCDRPSRRSTWRSTTGKSEHLLSEGWTSRRSSWPRFKAGETDPTRASVLDYVTALKDFKDSHEDVQLDARARGR